MSVTLDALRSRLDDKVVGPQDPDWDQARQAWNLTADQRPAAVVLPETTEDVAVAVQASREQGRRVAPQGTGHGAAAMGSLEAAVLVKTSRMGGVEVDPEAERAVVAAGALWSDVSSAAAEHALAGLQGSAGDVGVIGFSVGGGLGWLARSHGLAANRITAAEVVLADGRIVRADRETEPDLFWAIRGGGGSFGVVTELEIELVPVRELYAGVLFWPQDRAAEVLPAWRDWALGVPDELTSLGRLLNVPPLPDIPEPVRGKSFVVVEAAFLGGEEGGAELLEPLRALSPVMDTFDTIAPPGLAALHMDPPEPVPGAGDGLLLGPIPDTAIDALLRVAGPGSDSPLLSVELRALGGAVSRPHPDGGAADRLEADYAQYAVGMAMTPDMKRAVEATLEEVAHALASCATGTRCLNFTDREADRATMFPVDTYRRLREVKRAYDPDDVFLANHPITAA